MRYKLELSENQVKLVQNALELYFRIKVGQWDKIKDLCLDFNLPIDEYCLKRDLLNDVLLAARKIVYPGLNGTGDSYGVGQFEDSDAVWDIYQVIRYCIAWAENPKGGWATTLDEPVQWGNEPLPKCEAIKEETKEESKDDET